MCGIIGYYNKVTTKEDLETLRKVMLESRIRGKHASGIAWYNGNSIQSFVKPKPIDELIRKFNLSKLIYDNSAVSMIAHARYSTSDIKYNQPVIGDTLAVAHNGVITQSSPNTWEKMYGYRCKTKNDSELLLRALENQEDIFQKFPDSSIAAVVLDSTGVIRGYRNKYRPLWSGMIGQGIVWASTYDILDRAGVKNICKVPPVNPKQDLQKRSCLNGKER